MHPAGLTQPTLVHDSGRTLTRAVAGERIWMDDLLLKGPDGRMYRPKDKDMLQPLPAISVAMESAGEGESLLCEVDA